MKRGRAFVVAVTLMATTAVACGKVESKPDAALDAGNSEDVRADRATLDAEESDTQVDTPAAVDAGNDAARDGTTGDGSRDDVRGDVAPDHGAPVSDVSSENDGDLADGAPVPDVQGDGTVLDGPYGDVASDGGTRCVLGQSKVGNCTL